MEIPRPTRLWSRGCGSNFKGTCTTDAQEHNTPDTSETELDIKYIFIRLNGAFMEQDRRNEATNGTRPYGASGLAVHPNINVGVVQVQSVQTYCLRLQGTRYETQIKTGLTRTYIEPPQAFILPLNWDFTSEPHCTVLSHSVQCLPIWFVYPVVL